MNVKAQKFQSLYVPVCKSLARSNHRTTLPQSRPCGRASSLREGAGNGCTIHPATHKPQRCGRFSSPLRNSEDFGFYHSTDDTPSVTPNGRDSSLREGAGRGAYHSSSRPETATLRAIFIAPTKTQKFLHFTVQPAPQKSSGFHRKNDTGWGRAPPYGNPPKAQLKRGRVGKLSPGGNHADCISGGQSGHGPGGTSLYRQLRNEKTAAVNIPPQPIFCAKSSLPPYLQEPDTQPILSSYPDFAPHRPAAPPSQG